MPLCKFLTVLSLVLFSTTSFAQENNNETPAEPSVNKVVENTTAEPSAPAKPVLVNGILSQIASSIGDAAAKNISNAEQIFCYQIANRPENFDGYTLNGMAIAGFCGIINTELEKLIKTEFLTKEENLSFNETENCVIRPQIMLRFVRGVDSTDVLLSSPCHAIAFFYGGKISAFNAKPAAKIIDAIIEPLIKNKADFVSPTLLKQLLPIGVPQTEEQKELVNQKNEPLRSWQKQETQSPKKAGWNKLKSR